MSCRGLPRGMKREYSNEVLDKLRREIDDIIAEEDAERNTKERGRLEKAEKIDYTPSVLGCTKGNP